ncbi:MAG: outer membrane lipid asymmetry maintenance protein MlaD [Nitrospiraceae bacterium]|nr:MAG: outer membrane lipid asymmetry maintenance protein MlaD [Nitrospiraceae bacterium]
MKKYNMETTVGIFVIIGLLCLGYITIKLGNLSLINSDTYSLNTRFTSVSGLRTGNSVEMFGIEVGRVGKLSMDQNDQVAVVELKIHKDVEIFADAIASVKTSGLIGDRYIQIDPGGADEKLNHGDSIIETEAPIDLQEIIGKYAFGDVKEK